MLDLSKYEKNKDNYIVRLEIDDLFQKFNVIYASGKVEELDFSIHNYQVYLYRMEEQFEKYKGCYEKEKNDEFMNVMVTSLLQSILTMSGVVISMSSDIHLAIKILLTFLGGFLVFYNVNRVKNKKMELQGDIEKLALVEVLKNNKDDLSLNVIDPTTGEEAIWYVVDINNIDKFDSAFSLALYSLPYKYEGIKESMAEDLSNAFESAYVMKKNNDKQA